MIERSLVEIATDAGADTAGLAEVAARAAVVDSRLVTGGEIFVATAGERTNGNDHAADALARGAAGVLTDDPDRAIAGGADRSRIISVPDVVAALGRLAKANLALARRLGNPLVVGVTGSVGKTTTKDLLAHVLAPRGPIIAPPGSFNNEIGLPLTVLRADENTATLVVEMGADHVGNIDYLTDIAPLDIGIVLAVARAHIGGFGSLENVARAKSELVTGIRPGGLAILNADDPRVAAMSRLAERVTFFSATGNGDVAARNVDLGEDGRASFDLVIGAESAPVRLGLIGAHHVSNALAAAACAHAAGLSAGEIAGRLDAKAASPHRMDVWRSGDLTVIDDAYNANPDSMRAGIAALAQLGEGTKIAVLGAMLELGEGSDEEHASLGRELADRGIDTLIAHRAPALAAAAAEAGLKVREPADLDEAHAAVIEEIAGGGTILFKGSYGSKMWALADRLKEELC
ncbi:MAG: UDP-N-acetylmuramoyl-tripeptide--D-alanyl-D-alanine ligase [Flaviflexus sp.]|nr:UDP-N-acetylmuramoyl-tripeptide--D-alanyl-D-alanine ligase [Flaviflexus sp.]